ncbi:MAG: ABC transporter permease, partial [Microbacterium sp.]
MAAYVWRRLWQAILVLFGVAVVTFVLLHLSGDPTSLMLPLEATPAEHDAMRARLGLDQPLPVQF